MHKLPDWFYADRLTPINYYGYTSATREVFFEHFWDEKDPDVIARFNDLKRKCMMTPLDVRREGDKDPAWTKDVWDNKVVIECETEQGERIFVGYHDGTLTLGRKFYSKDGRTAQPYMNIENPLDLAE